MRPGDHHGTQQEDHSSGQGLRNHQAGHALPGLRHAAPRLWRTGRACRRGFGCDHRQHRHLRGLGQRPGHAGAGRGAVLDGVSFWKESGEGPHSLLSLDRGRVERHGHDSGRTRHPECRAPGQQRQIDLRGGLQCLDQSACQCQPGSPDSGRRKSCRVHCRAGQLSYTHRQIRRHSPAGLYSVRNVWD